ncbi:MAG: hypothetical protein GWP75_05910, partial [Planctomycetia bacterium]|nr:hypothetical protein [Planctomycetia bacterium]
QGLCAKRGLTPESDVQTFEIFISSDVRRRFDEANAGAASGANLQAHAGRPPPQQRSERRRGFRSAPEDALRKQREVNDFLVAFINGTLDSHRLDARPKARARPPLRTARRRRSRPIPRHRDRRR